MDQVKNSYAWKESVELSLELIRICEEFTNGDRNVLVGHLRQAVVDVPSSIASDIKHSRGANLNPVIKLITELELVHKVYPAVDTGTAPELAAKLLQRMESDKFHETEPTETPKTDSEPEAEPETEEAEVEIETEADGDEQPEVQNEPAVSNEEPESNTEPESKPAPRLIQVNTDNS